ncbi:hypothetical protein C8J57DRAFT_1414021, partial [Mycena rebaudengoi]
TFRLSTILSTSVALLLAAQSVSAAPTHEISRSLIPRQSTTDSPQCNALCDPANAIVAGAPKDACTDANVDKVAACFNCAVAAGEDREIVQEVGDGLVDVCKTAGFPVKSVTIEAGGAAGGSGTPPATPSGGSGTPPADPSAGTDGDKKTGGARSVSASAAGVAIGLVTVSLVL